MTHSTNLYIVSSDESISNYISEVASRMALKLGVGLIELNSIEDLARAKDTNLPLLAIIDTDSRESDGFQRVQELMRQMHRPQIVTVSNSLNQSDLINAMQNGVRSCLLREELHDTLLPAIQLLMSEVTTDSPSRGSVIMVMGTTGGVGSSVTAVNLSKELGIMSTRQSLLIDMDLAYGSISTLLALSPPFGLADLLSHQSEIDEELVSSAAIESGEDVSVLASSASADPLHRIAYEHDQLSKIISIAKDIYPFTIIDTPRLDPELAISMADQSDYLILVMEMSVLGIRNAKALITSLLANGFTESKIRVVANRYEPRRSSISIDDATEALNGIPVHAFPNDYRVVSRSANLGKPVADVSPRSKFRKAIISLVDAITPKTSRSA